MSKSRFEVSVIIPVYNAAPFVLEAVESALLQPETVEVILVEDGSPDNSLVICQTLAEQNEKVRLFRHPDGENRGAAASRNLGMRNAQFGYIAFLDADDYFLPGRFETAKEVFANDPECGGVYEAIGTFIQDQVAMERWKDSKEMQSNLITMTEAVPPEELLEKLVLRTAGYFSPNGLVIKQSLLEMTGFMDESLKLHQDNDFMYRCAGVAKLLPGRLDEPVAIRRVHSQNRITSPRSQKQKFRDRLKMWKVTYRWFKANTAREKRGLVLKGIFKFWQNDYWPTKKSQSYLMQEFMNRMSLLFLPLHLPEVIFELNYWVAYFPARIRMRIK